VVLDTNVFVSGVFFGGTPHDILQAWATGAVEVVVSPEILDEYRRVAEELATRFPEAEVSRLLEFTAVNALVFAAEPLPDQICDDPDDDKFLACALASGAKIVVTGDPGPAEDRRLRRRSRDEAQGLRDRLPVLSRWTPRWPGGELQSAPTTWSSVRHPAGPGLLRSGPGQAPLPQNLLSVGGRGLNAGSRSALPGH
jgi:putative PIN family toxin of toxin-antitoxin system